MQRRGPEWRLWSEGFPPSLSGPSEKSGGEVGCCEVTSITLLNESSGVGGVKGEEQNAGVDHKGHKKKRSSKSPSAALYLHPAREGLSDVLYGYTRERVPEPTAFRQEVKVLLSCSPPSHQQRSTAFWCIRCCFDYITKASGG